LFEAWISFKYPNREEELNEMKVYDVTVTLRPGMPVWPGEPGMEIRRVMSIKDGMAANVSAFKTGCHIGTHVDAPLHFIEGGKSIEELSLDLFVGRVTVYSMAVEQFIDIADIESLGIQNGERVIFKTANSSLWEKEGFETDFIFITERAAQYLVNIGVKTVGIDYLSVEQYGMEGSPTHHILLGGGVGVIEGLDLRGVEDGEYDLFCLPLKLAGADGSPARVILRGIE
jgi:arylformamidase